MNVLVVGAGQVGSALVDILNKKHNVTLWDVEARHKCATFDVLHICYPYSESFIKYTQLYMQRFKPQLTFIESTVKPNTTALIHKQLPFFLLCHSPIRGCHANLLWGIQQYTKFIGPTSIKAGLIAEVYYQNLGLKTFLAHSSLETELAKLLNLSYYAAQIAFFQEVERKIENHKANYNDIIRFFETTTEESNGDIHRPVFKGNFIGGHCVMDGLKLAFGMSDLWNWVSASNARVQKT